jgi:aspartate carbamoyltransferase
MQKSTLQSIDGDFKNKNILSSIQFSKKDIDILFKTTNKIKKIVQKKGHSDILKGKIISLIFYEPSSRTFGSFVTAAQRFSAGFIPLQGMNNSSHAKGETLQDTIKTFASYSDLIVLRHPEEGSSEIAAGVSQVPVVNAGDGTGEHPTQALIDLYTIKEKFGKLNGLSIVFFGELGHYRPVNSLVKLLALYPHNKISLVSPDPGKIKSEIRNYLKQKKVNFVEREELGSAIKNADILYVTRVKKEFMSDSLYKKLKGKYIVDKKVLGKMKKTSIIMHPLPRIDEIDTRIDDDPRAIYFRSQIKNGIYIRMALIALVLGGKI